MELSYLRAVPFAHRGLHRSGVPENSLAAVRAAVEVGLGVEVDVRVCRDGIAVVHHDPTLARSCGEPGRVRDLDSGALRRRHLRDSTESIPSLTEVLDAVQGRVPVLVDLKAGFAPVERRRLVRAVVAATDGYVGPLAVVSYDPLVLRAVAGALPGAARGQTGGIPHSTRRSVAVGRSALQQLDRYWLNRLCAPHFLTCNVDSLPHPSMQRHRALGVTVLGWTVRTLGQLTQLATEVDGLIVEDEAAWALAGGAAAG